MAPSNAHFSINVLRLASRRPCSSLSAQGILRFRHSHYYIVTFHPLDEALPSPTEHVDGGYFSTSCFVAQRSGALICGTYEGAHRMPFRKLCYLSDVWRNSGKESQRALAVASELKRTALK